MNILISIWRLRFVFLHASTYHRPNYLPVHIFPSACDHVTCVSARARARAQREVHTSARRGGGGGGVCVVNMPVCLVQVVGGAWLFSRLYCNIFVTLDVMMCTASILNLCAISIDR